MSWCSARGVGRGAGGEGRGVSSKVILVMVEELSVRLWLLVMYWK